MQKTPFNFGIPRYIWYHVYYLTNPAMTGLPAIAGYYGSSQIRRWLNLGGRPQKPLPTALRVLLFFAPSFLEDVEDVLPHPANWRRNSPDEEVPARPG
ncbi:MAG: hypothetical protein ACLSB9_33875 [Hydrogeniiclostridium mannosilyticum]